MPRIGKLTGRVYGDNVKASSIGECCIMVKKDELYEQYRKWKLTKTIHDDCSDCRGCPEYYKES